MVPRFVLHCYVENRYGPVVAVGVDRVSQEGDDARDRVGEVALVERGACRGGRGWQSRAGSRATRRWRRVESGDAPGAYSISTKRPTFS